MVTFSLASIGLDVAVLAVMICTCVLDSLFVVVEFSLVTFSLVSIGLEVDVRAVMICTCSLDS